MVLYSICDYNGIKSAATNTWPYMVLPGHVRACFFCGEICTYGRKELSCEEVGEMLTEQKMLCSTDVFHCTMQNMLTHCQGAYKQSTGDASRVLSCPACYNWIMHRRQTLPFITPVQVLHWFFNTLGNTIPKKIDNRIISGLWDRLLRTEHNIPNYYYTLFSPHEQSTIQKIAQHKDAGMLEGIIAQHFFQACKQSPIVLGCSISNFLRHNMKDDGIFSMNVYRAQTPHE
jgi:hypothetical protein